MVEDDEMIRLSRALEIVREALGEMRLPTETLPVARAHGRILVGEQVSRLDLPPFDKSAMDGYAVGAGDERGEHRLAETVQAGCAPTRPLAPGTAVKIMTGAPVPEGTAKVVMLERTVEADGIVRVLSPEPTTNICPQGEDVRRGDVILQAAHRLGPAEIANLIACGVTEVEVYRSARVEVLSTGNEIVDSPEKLSPGKIMNSNGPMLVALCDRAGLEVVGSEVVPDRRGETVATLRRAVDRADIVILSGGVSVGEYDFVTSALSEVGLHVHFGRVAIKPGKPMTFASGEGTAVFGLPGNPVSAYLMCHLFVLPAARMMAGGGGDVAYVALPLAQQFKRRKADRLQYVPCVCTSEGTLEAVEFHGSAHLRALLESDGFFVVPEGVNVCPAGERVRFLPAEGRLR